MQHERFMEIALAEAQQALREDEVPIGAVIVHQGRVIASAHNQREALGDPTAHAEMIAITQAAGGSGPGDSTAARFTSRSSLARCAPAVCSRPGLRRWSMARPIPRPAPSTRSISCSATRA